MRTDASYWYVKKDGDYKLNLDEEDIQFLHKKAQQWLGDINGEVSSDIVRMANLFFFEKSKLTKEYQQRMLFSSYNMSAIESLIRY